MAGRSAQPGYGTLACGVTLFTLAQGARPRFGKRGAGQESDPEFLDRIQALAAPFSLAEGETKTLSLKLNAVP
jgi:hypothetical protein